MPIQGKSRLEVHKKKHFISHLDKKAPQYSQAQYYIMKIRELTVDVRVFNVE